MDVFIVVIWIFVTFFVGSLAGILGKKYGPEYPIAMIAALIVMSNFFATKIVMFGPFSVPAGVIVFSMTFFITDILSEKWGKKYAKKAVWAGFISNLLLVISLYMVINWQPAPFAIEVSDMFKSIFNITPRIIIAGFVAYLVSQNHDVWAFHFWRKVTRGKHLWLRNNASTVTSQLLDSVIFVTIAFYGVFPVWPLILGNWVVKTLIALIDTPFIYAALGMMKRVRRIKVSPN